MRVVLDTNVFISAIFWEGPPHEILTLAEQGKVTLAASQETLDELFGVLARKKFDRYFKEAQTDHKRISEYILFLVEVFSPKEEVSIIKEDPPDNQFLSCALAAGTLFVVSGDRHLLGLKEFRNIPIITPKQFLIRMKRANL